ncbi:AAA family ATPase [Deinococcus alpinitundrae]|uniref:AAA family ATPase n=1 Tax=Deinococcus alpinitundrae TaxID=468913 RepID=UPI00137ADFB8|nr:AAA family ATPase [Deinococcus alpinitundrae]
MSDRPKVLPLPVLNGPTAPDTAPVEWLIRGLLARGAGTILFGQPGVSKSVHAAYILACLMSGVPFAGLKTTERPLRVLYVDFDSTWQWNREIFMAAFRGVGIEGLPAGFYYYSPNSEECCPDSEADNLQTLEALGPAIAATVTEFDIDLVICDSLGQMMVGDTNSGQDVALALRLGLNPARKAGAAVLVIDHATKSAAASNGVPTPMGSQQKRAWARVCVVIEKEEGQENVVRWSIDKTNAKPFRPFLTRLTFVGSDDRLDMLKVEHLGDAGPRKTAQERPNRHDEVSEEILGILQTGPQPRSRFSEAGTYERALKELEKAGRIVRPKRGQYALLDDSEAAPSYRPPERGVTAEPADMEVRTW